MRNSQEALIIVENEAQKVLLDTELLGQFSDGYWENSRNESWNYLGNVQVANDSVTGVIFKKNIPYSYKGYSVNNKTLLSYVGDRMLVKARVANYLKISDIDGVEALLEYSCSNVIDRGNVVTEDDIADKIEEWQRDKSEFWNKRAVSSLEFIGKVGFEKFLKAVNSDYSVKDMRKDLTQITKILKDTKFCA
jgi:hypothetical protein